MSELSELFDRDPFGLTDPDIATIVTALRQHQAQFELGGKVAAAPKPKKPSKAESILKDLGLT